MSDRHFSSESGNALWFILLAVALIAALTVTISRSSDTAEQSGDIERARIQASDIVRFAKGIEQAVEQMQMRGLSETEIEFEDEDLSASYDAPACTTTACQVFHPNGGGIAYETPDVTWLDTEQSSEDHYGEWFFPALTCIPNVGRGGSGCHADSISNEETLIVMPWIKRSLCVEINNLIGIDNPGGDPPAVSEAAFDSGYTAQRSLYINGGTVQESARIIDAGGVLDGQKSGCFEGTGSATPPAGSYHFYHTLIAR